MARRTRKSIPKIAAALPDNEPDTPVDDGELPAEDWEELSDDDEESEPENLIEEILAAVAAPGDATDEEEDEDVPARPAPVEDPDDEDDDLDDGTFAEIRARGKDEFTCQSCWLIRLDALRSKRDPSVCRDCD